MYTIEHVKNKKIKQQHRDKRDAFTGNEERKR